MADRSGQQLGNYRLLHLLGQGTFADVYLGEHLFLKTPLVAIKAFNMQFSEKEASDFLLVISRIRLRHPNIVSILDIGVEEATGTSFIVMEYLSKGTMRQYLPGRMPVALVLVVQY